MATSLEPRLVSLIENIQRVIRGKPLAVKCAVVSLLARGHLLIEDVPGVGKTTLAYSLAKSVDCSFSRIQFTSDMLPSDVLGVTIYDADTKAFKFEPGPIFSNVVLADELNRTTPKTQSSLLEVMDRAQVSMDGRSYAIQPPFIVIATQNPIEFHGTFPLPKSQMDRFLMRISMGYPERSSELEILKSSQLSYSEIQLKPVLSAPEVVKLQQEVEKVEIEEDLLVYIIKLIEATRKSPLIELGVSPRGTVALKKCVQAHAFLEGRNYVVPDDIKLLAGPVMAHRIKLQDTFDGMSSKDDRSAEVIQDILTKVEVPS